MCLDPFSGMIRPSCLKQDDPWVQAAFAMRPDPVKTVQYTIAAKMDIVNAMNVWPGIQNLQVRNGKMYFTLDGERYWSPKNEKLRDMKFMSSVAFVMEQTEYEALRQAINDASLQKATVAVPKEEIDQLMFKANLELLEEMKAVRGELDISNKLAKEQLDALLKIQAKTEFDKAQVQAGVEAFNDPREQPKVAWRFARVVAKRGSAANYHPDTAKDLLILIDKLVELGEEFRVEYTYDYK